MPSDKYVFDVYRGTKVTDGRRATHTTFINALGHGQLEIPDADVRPNANTAGSVECVLTVANAKFVWTEMIDGLRLGQGNQISGFYWIRQPELEFGDKIGRMVLIRGKVSGYRSTVPK